MQVTESFLRAALDALKREIFSALRVCLPGEILAYDASTGRASVQPSLSRALASGEALPAPVLQDVAVLRPTRETKVSPGSPCVLLFADCCLDAWLDSGGAPVPPSPRMHDLSDAIALVGFFGGDAA